MKFKTITKGASIISVVLWIVAASLWVNSGVASFAIIGVLAATAQIIAVNSARREGEIAGRRTWFVDKILDEVGEDGRDP